MARIKGNGGGAGDIDVAFKDQPSTGCGMPVKGWTKEA